MASGKTPQYLKPTTAAKKLGVYLPATPVEFQENSTSRKTLAEYLTDPPEWLTRLRAEGPHPRPVVAEKLGVSVSGLARAGIDDALTTAQIEQLLADRPDWLRQERETQAKVRAESRRLKAQKKAEPQ